MTKLKFVLPIILTITSAQITSAMNYVSTHLLLVFREDGFNDVEIDIGSVSNYLGLASGTSFTVNYDTNLVRGNFNNTYSGVKVALVAATDTSDSLLRVWVTDANLVSTPTDVTGGKHSALRGKVSSVGLAATAVTASNASPFVVSASDPNAYSYIVSGVSSAIDTFGGDMAFPVAAVNPATLAFYDIRPSGVTPKPPARLIGTFTWNVAGILTFTAGAAQTPLTASTITGIIRSNGVNVVSFTTTNGLNYNLFSAGPVIGAFTKVAGPIAGDNTIKSLSHTSGDAHRFYRIEATH